MPFPIMHFSTINPLLLFRMHRKCFSRFYSTLLKSDSMKIFLFGSFLFWQLPCTGFMRTFLRLFTGKLCVQLSIFIFIHFSRFSLRHLSRRFLPYHHIEFLPNLDSPKHNLRESFRPFLKTIPKCGNGQFYGKIKEEDKEKEEIKKKALIFTFIRTHRKKSQFA